ncbi:hypothetical protein Tco_1196888 [Tanacetum coccineum]
MDGEVPKFLTDEKVGKRYKTYESSLFNTESGDACVNLNVDAGYDEEDEVRDVAPRPIGRDKAKNLKKKWVGSSGTSSIMNDEALARLMVFELAMHNEHAKEMMKQERAEFLEIKKKEMKIHEQELAMQEYKQRQKDKMFYMHPYNP